MVKLLEGPRIGDEIKGTYKQIRLQPIEEPLPDADLPEAKRRKGIDRRRLFSGRSQCLWITIKGCCARGCSCVVHSRVCWGMTTVRVQGSHVVLRFCWPMYAVHRRGCSS